MLENIEIDQKMKTQLKIIAAIHNTTMKQLVLPQINKIIEEDQPIDKIPSTQDRESFIINIDDTLDAKIRQHAYEHEVKIKDVWVQAINQIIKEKGESQYDEKII